MAEFQRTIDIGSDHVPVKYCEQCFKVNKAEKSVAGYCQNCDQDLCFACFSTHLLRTPFRNHQLVDKSTNPKLKPVSKTKPQNLAKECYLHHGERLLLFCYRHNQCCCKVCLTINHQACQTEKISKLSRNMRNSQELKNLNQQLNKLKKGFNSNLSITGANEKVIRKTHREAVNNIKKLRDEFDKLATETEAQADKVNEEDFKTIEKVSATCGIAIEQINKLTTNLDTLKENEEAESLFISMKQTESQLMSLEENLDKLDKVNTVRKYKFEPDERLKTLLIDLNVLGHFSFEQKQATGFPQQLKVESLSDKKAKGQTYVKDINIKSNLDMEFDVCGCVVLQNKKILITDLTNKKVKLVYTNHNKVISEIQVDGKPRDITKVKYDEVAVIVEGPPHKIKFVSVSHQSLATVREISVNGCCKGIAYNETDHTLIVTSVELGALYNGPSKIEIFNMAGDVIKCLDKDSKGNQLFSAPFYVALSPNMTDMYITDRDKNTVTLITLNGDVKAVYKDKSLKGPRGISVHKSGLVNVVGGYSHTVQELDPASGEFKILLEQKDGLKGPRSISFSELEDKMYIGMTSLKRV